MKYLILILSLLLTACTATPYVTVGAGLKLDEPDITWNDGSDATHPVSARFEVGLEQGPWTYGVSHHSQWIDVTSGGEYHKTEVFVDYTWRFE